MAISGHAPGSAVTAVTLAMTILAAMAVSARLFARRVVVRNAGIDDGFITAALLFSIATTVTMILQVKWGMGRHIQTLSLHESISAQKAFYISIWVYNLSMSCTKFSILLQYLRIFPQHRFRQACYIMICVVGVYTCWTFFSAVFACWPISYFWTQIEDPQGGRCLDRFAVWFANAGLNIATDIGIGVLPLNVLRSLELPRRQRIALMVVFGLGGFTCVVSILRLQSLYVISRAKDVTWENPLAAIWSSVEINTGILCSCLPTLRSCIARIFPKLLGSLRGSPNSSNGDAKQDENTSGGSSSEGSKDLTNSQTTRNKANKLSAASFKRGLTGWSQATQTSQIHSEGVRERDQRVPKKLEQRRSEQNSWDDIDLSYLGPYVSEGAGGIQVTTVVEQDVEQVARADDEESTRSLFGLVGGSPRAVEQSSPSTIRLVEDHLRVDD